MIEEPSSPQASTHLSNDPHQSELLAVHNALCRTTGMLTEPAWTQLKWVGAQLVELLYTSHVGAEGSHFLSDTPLILQAGDPRLCFHAVTTDSIMKDFSSVIKPN